MERRNNFLFLPVLLGVQPPITLIISSNMKKFFALLVLAGASGLIGNSAFAADIVGDAKAAHNKVAMCIGCHAIPGYKATFPEVFQVPMIGGQNAKYLENALRAYQKGERKHPTMRDIARGLSEQDIADVAAFYAAQK
jgi:cytochrome c553